MVPLVGFIVLIVFLVVGGSLWIMGDLNAMLMPGSGSKSMPRFIIPARKKKSLLNLFADHPPLEQRLAALERLESQLQGVA